MRKESCAVFVAGLLMSLIVGQSICWSEPWGPWRYLYPRPQGETLYTVKALDENRAVAVGKLGTIMLTTDGGENWSVTPSGTRGNFEDVDFDGDLGVAVGQNGTIIISKDGGRTWKPAYSEVPQQDFRGVAVKDGITWAVGEEGIIIHSGDGGRSWNQQSSGSDKLLFDVDFIDALHGRACGGAAYDRAGEILQTVDGGAQWNTTTQVPIAMFCAVEFLDTAHGWVGGMCLQGANATPALFTTDDGCDTWDIIFPPGNFSTDDPFNDISHPTESDGYVVERGYMARTTNGGATWDDCLISNVTSVDFIDAASGWVSGFTGLIAHSSDYGLTWNKQVENIGFRLFDSISMVNDHTLFACGPFPGGWGGYKVSYTDNRGETWVISPLFPSIKLNAVEATNVESAVVAGSFPSGAGVIYLTQDSGLSWEQTHVISERLNDLSFPEPQIGFAVGDDGVILKTEDGGINWSSQSGPIAEDLAAVDFIDAGQGWAVGGDDGVVLRTANGGYSWQVVTTGIEQKLHPTHIAFASAIRGWVIGSGGKIYATADGGSTWSRQESGLTSRLDGICVIDENHLAIVSENHILYTSDGGSCWEMADSKTEANLRDIDHSGGLTLAVGDGCRILACDGINSVCFASSIDPPSSAGGVIPLECRIEDPDNDLMSVEISYRPSGSGQWLPATIASETEELASGYHYVRWDSLVDLPGQTVEVEVKIWPSDPFEPGTPAISEPFEVDNPTPIPTPTPPNIGVTLEMPSHYFAPDDQCWLRARVSNPYSESFTAALFVFLDIGVGEYWFWPSWCHYPPLVDYQEIEVRPGVSEYEIISPFPWPTGAGSASGCQFWGGITDPEITELIGELGSWEFSYGESVATINKSAWPGLAREPNPTGFPFAALKVIPEAEKIGNTRGQRIGVKSFLKKKED